MTDIFQTTDFMENEYTLLQEQVIHFRNLVSEIDISKYDQTGYISVVNSIYYEIFIAQEEE
tara:strand:- start:322 stop:504 length:183 start_codon:yes stop_codon:yes gene_type:complete